MKLRKGEIKVAIVEDDFFFAETLQKVISGKEIDSYIFHSAEEFLQEVKKTVFHIVLIDYKLPDKNGISLIKELKKKSPVSFSLLISGQDDIEVVVDAYRQGAKAYIIKNENCFPEVSNTINNLIEIFELKKEVSLLRSENYTNSIDKIIGESLEIKNVKLLIRKAAKANILTLITGESGSGKELVANAVHEESDRNEKTLVTVNMAAIPKDLVESELFGHEKGAFTGANNRRIGKFEEANGGTIFLDEIGEIELSIQAKLLRVLENKTITRIGSNASIKLDIRVIAATNRDLKKDVEEGSFRKDLFFRLQGILIQMPPLRHRKNDIVPLANHFMDRFIAKNKMSTVRLSRKAINKLINYSWPGNIRELKSVIERSVLLSESETINIELKDNESLKDRIEENEMSMEDYKNMILQHYMKKYDHNIDHISKKLKLSRATIYRMLKKEDAN